MVERILVPLDGSSEAEEAIPYATALLPDGREAALLRVVPDVESPWTGLRETLAPPPVGADDSELVAARAALDAVPARFPEARVHWTAEVVRGDPAETIVRFAQSLGADLIVMTTHGRDAVGRVLFGSVADRVARSSAVPVLLARPGVPGAPPAAMTFRRIVAPLDGSEVAETALPVAADLARTLRVPIRLMRVVDPSMTVARLAGIGYPGAPISAELCQQALNDVREDARQSLAAAAARLTAEGLQATWTVTDGSPYFAIADATEPGDLLVLSSHGRSGVLRWALGSVAEKLVRTAPAPVVLVPAPGRGSA
ncbi:MAG TPA: universal stress protein [Thermomicrobiales bacterium]|nr:universal stress protein [Thermomicrobiales bacterium]